MNFHPVVCILSVLVSFRHSLNNLVVVVVVVVDHNTVAYDPISFIMKICVEFLAQVLKSV